MLSLELMSMIFILSLMILLVNFFISKKLFKNREKSPFECGVDPMSQSRMPFSFQFFMISFNFFNFWHWNYFINPLNLYIFF